MKIKTLTFLLLLTTSAVFGQIPKNAISIEDEAFNEYFQNSENTPVVKGKFLNLPQEIYDKIKINYSIVTPFDQRQVKKNCTLNADGSFELELDHAFPYQQIWLDAGPFYAGIYANTELFIELDAEVLRQQKGVKFNGPGVKYLGQDGELNNFLNNHVLFEREKQLEISKSLSQLKSQRTLNHGEFTLKYDSLYALLSELDNEFIKQNPSEDAWIIENERNSDYYGDLCVWFWGKEMTVELFKEVKDHKSYLISNSGMGFYNSLFYFLSINSRIEQPVHVHAVRDYSKLGESEKSILDSIQLIEDGMSQMQPYDSIKYMSLIEEAHTFLRDTMFIVNTLQTIKYLDKQFNGSKSDFLKLRLTSQDPDVKKIITEAVLATVKTEWVSEVIQAQYNEGLEKLASINDILHESKPIASNDLLGEPIVEMPTGARLYKVDNMEPETLLANLKNSFKNKALLIDFWATWCAPCIQEMPYSKKLHEEAADLPIEFVYLCTSSSSNIEKWKSKVADLRLGGTHIFVEQSIEDELMNLFSVSGFPSYVLINTEGDYKPGAISRMSLLNKAALSDLIK